MYNERSSKIFTDPIRKNAYIWVVSLSVLYSVVYPPSF